MIRLMSSSSILLATILGVLLTLFDGQTWYQVASIGGFAIAVGVLIYLMVRLWVRIRPVPPRPLCKWQLIRYGD